MASTNKTTSKYGECILQEIFFLMGTVNQSFFFIILGQNGFFFFFLLWRYQIFAGDIWVLIKTQVIEAQCNKIFQHLKKIEKIQSVVFKTVEQYKGII